MTAAHDTLHAITPTAPHYAAAQTAVGNADAAWQDAAAWYAATADGYRELRDLRDMFTAMTSPHAAVEAARYTTALRRGAMLRLVAAETARRLNRPTHPPASCLPPAATTAA